MIKYITLIILLILSTVAVSVAVAVPLAMQTPNGSASAVAASEPGYMYTLKSSEKSNYIITSLADQRLVRLQLVLELEKSFEPKNTKNPDRQMLELQDALLRAIRSCRSDDLSVQKQAAFKKLISDTTAQVLGNNAIRAVYVTGVTVQ